MAALEPCIFRGKRAPKSENDNTSEDSEVDNRLERIHFDDLVKDDKSVARVFSGSHQFRIAQNDVTSTRSTKFSKWQSPKRRDDVLDSY